MESGGQSKIQSKRMRLAEAIDFGRLYQTKMILEDNPNLNYIDGEGLSPLVRALMIEDEKHRTRVAMVKLLLQHKADVNFQDNRGKHVLNWACSLNKLDLVKLLLEKCLQDVDLTSQDTDGNTPLMYAVKNNNIVMVRLLVNVMRRFSLSVDQRNREDRTAYYEAVEMGFKECATILSHVGKASRGIKVNPFLETLGFTNAAVGDGVRVRSASPVKDCTRHGINVGQRKGAGDRRNTTMKNNPERKRKGFCRGKKRAGNRLRRSGKVHSEVSRKGPGENIPKITNLVEGKEESGNIKRKGKNSNDGHDKSVVLLQDNSARGKLNRDEGELDESNYVKNAPENGNSDSSKQERFLRLVLDEYGSEGMMSRRSQTPITGVLTNPVSRSVTPANEMQGRERNNVQKRLGNVCHAQQTTLVSKNTLMNRDYYAYLEWKASLDSSANSLRNLLALRAEQQSEISSYRKGHVLPKYDVPLTDELVGDTSADGVVTPVSERSEAARKISAVAKTVRLSLYLANRQKREKNSKSFELGNEEF